MTESTGRRAAGPPDGAWPFHPTSSYLSGERSPESESRVTGPAGVTERVRSSERGEPSEPAAVAGSVPRAAAAAHAGGDPARAAAPTEPAASPAQTEPAGPIEATASAASPARTEPAGAIEPTASAASAASPARTEPAGPIEPAEPAGPAAHAHPPPRARRSRRPLVVAGVAVVVLAGGAAAAALAGAFDRAAPGAASETVVLPSPTPTIAPVERQPVSPFADSLPSTVLGYALASLVEEPPLLAAGALEGYRLDYSDGGTGTVTVTAGQWETDADAATALATATAAAGAGAVPATDGEPTSGEVQVGGAVVGSWTLSRAADGTGTVTWSNGTVVLQATGPADVVRDVYAAYPY